MPYTVDRMFIILINSQINWKINVIQVLRLFFTLYKLLNPINTRCLVKGWKKITKIFMSTFSPSSNVLKWRICSWLCTTDTMWLSRVLHTCDAVPPTWTSRFCPGPSCGSFVDSPNQRGPYHWKTVCFLQKTKQWSLSRTHKYSLFIQVIYWYREAENIPQCSYLSQGCCHWELQLQLNM